MMEDRPMTYDEYVRAISRMPRPRLKTMLRIQYRLQGVRVVHGGPDSMSKDELIAALCRAKRGEAI